MSDKKELAIVIGATGNLAFGVANVFMGLKNHPSSVNYDLVLYYGNFSDKDLQLLQNIHPCKLIEYECPLDVEELKKISGRKIASLTFSRYECFKMLKDYKNVVWLDCDVLVQKDISTILNYCETGIGMHTSKAPIRWNYSSPVPGYDMNKNNYNSGVIVLGDNLPEYEKIANWCYKKTTEIAPYFRLKDQGVLNLLSQDFGIEITELPEEYNCYPFVPEITVNGDEITVNSRNKSREKLKEAVIIHAVSQKFWETTDFKEWNENYKKWIEMEGSPVKGNNSFAYKTFCRLKASLKLGRFKKLLRRS